MKKNKKIILVSLIILVVIISLIFILKNMIKNSKVGNNMGSQEIVDYILSRNSYKSKVTVQVNSNKNQNKYILKQEYNTENGCMQEVIEPTNISGVKIIKKENKLSIENTNLNLKTIFENYQELENNNLDLNVFLQDYKNNGTFEESETEIIMKTNIIENRYTKSKILYINKKNKLPIKLLIQDNNQNTRIFIEYNEIELN